MVNHGTASSYVCLSFMRKAPVTHFGMSAVAGVVDSSLVHPPPVAHSSVANQCAQIARKRLHLDKAYSPIGPRLALYLVFVKAQRYLRRTTVDALDLEGGPPDQTLQTSQFSTELSGS